MAKPELGKPQTSATSALRIDIAKALLKRCIIRGFATHQRFRIARSWAQAPWHFKPSLLRASERLPECRDIGRVIAAGSLLAVDVP